MKLAIGDINKGYDYLTEYFPFVSYRFWFVIMERGLDREWLNEDFEVDKLLL